MSEPTPPCHWCGGETYVAMMPKPYVSCSSEICNAGGPFAETPEEAIASYIKVGLVPVLTSGSPNETGWHWIQLSPSSEPYPSFLDEYDLQRGETSYIYRHAGPLAIPMET